METKQIHPNLIKCAIFELLTEGVKITKDEIYYLIERQTNHMLKYGKNSLFDTDTYNQLLGDNKEKIDNIYNTLIN